jgi:hypothetical protein
VAVAAVVLVFLAVIVTAAVLTFGRGKSPATSPELAANSVPPPATARKVPAVKPQLWSPLSGVSQWEVLTDPERLKVYTESTSLLQLGETSADSWELSATIRQVAGAGRVGLFLGYRKDPRTATATYELVRLLTSPGEMYIQRRVESYSLDAPLRETEGETHASVLIPQAAEYTIRLSVRGNRLAGVWVNDAPVPQLVNVPLHLPAAGAFGVSNKKSDGVFRKLLFNDRPIPLFADANAPSEKP